MSVGLSVIIPTCNSEATIEACLKSLICQTYRNFEICIIDGGSKDKTLLKVLEVRSCFPNIRILSEPDDGVYDAMNKGIRLAQGDWLLFLGSDDKIIDKEVFSDILKLAACKDVIYGNTYINDDVSWARAGQIYDGMFNLEKLLSKNICHQSIFYKRKLFERFGDYKIQYKVCADWEMNLRLFAKTNFSYVDRTVSVFHGDGLSSRVSDEAMSRDIKKLRNKALRNYRINKFINKFACFINFLP